MIHDIDVMTQLFHGTEPEISTLVDCVRAGWPFPITLEEGSADLEVCERIAACYAGGTPHGGTASGLSPVKDY